MAKPNGTVRADSKAKLIVAISLGAFFAEAQVALALIAAFIVLWGYFIWFETVWNGQTPGKRQMGLRVVRDGGYPINIYAAIVRNLIRLMDGMPIVALGLIIAGAVGHQTLTAATGGIAATSSPARPRIRRSTRGQN